jgi:DNA polymerase III sliding clamp (beta) subunit (PCNA family)
LAQGDSFEASLSAADAFSFKAFPRKDKVRMEVGDTYIESDCKGKMLSMRFAEFEGLPDFEKLAGEEFSTSIDIARMPLLNALERSLATTKTRNTPVVLDLSGHKGDVFNIYFSGETQRMESVPLKLTGERVRLAFNPIFATAAFGSFSTSAVRISVTHPNKPVLITSDDEPEHRHVLMPVRLGT